MCQRNKRDCVKLYETIFKAMGTRCEIQLYASTAEQALMAANNVIADVERLEALYSRYRPSSFLSAINRIAEQGGSITVDVETSHLLNYAATCKTCNSTLKATYFPTAKKPDSQGRSPGLLMKKEQPYLIYPIGNFDAAAEELISFIGLIPVPAKPAADQYAHDRGRVTIAFFGLSLREDLIKGRALLIWWSYREGPEEMERTGVDQAKSILSKLFHVFSGSRWARCFTIIR